MRLGYTSPENEPEYLDLGLEPLTIGRWEGNGLVISEPFISRKHAQIEPTSDGNYQIQDRGSRNGTYLNREPVGSEPRVLQEGDLITLGSDPYTVDLFFAKNPDADVTATTRMPNSGPAHPLGEIGLELDRGSRELRLHGRPLRPGLTQTQFEMMSLLWDRRGSAVPLDEIGQACWGDQAKPARAQELHTYAHRIRLKLREAGVTEDILQNVRGFGYRLDRDPLGLAATVGPN